MAEDQSQRPYRSNEARARAGNSASDPLAELARLIGQTDPFAEFGRDNTRRPAGRQSAQAGTQPAVPPASIEYAPRTPEAAAGAPAVDPVDYYAASTAPQLPLPEAQSFAAPNYGRQAYGGAPLATGNDLYQVENDAAGYQGAPDGGYDNDPYRQNAGDAGDAGDQDLYDEVPPARRRMGIVAIAGVFALAVLGTAGAFGYRAIFGTSGSSAPPPVIKAESAPSKIVPSTVGKDAQSSKLITDRVNDRALGEKLVSREEQPVEIKDKGVGSLFPPPQDRMQSGSVQPPLGSGVVGTEPKKVRTIAIHPDQVGASASADAMPSSPPPAATSPAPRVTNITPARPAPLPPPRVAEPEPAPRPPAARPAPQMQLQAAAPSNAPLSLNPNAPAARPAPTRTAAVAPTPLAPSAAASGGAGGFAVQVSSQRSEADAQAAFRSLQGKFPDQLGGRQPLIRQVDLGAKGVYYRAMVGPFASGSDATSLCSSLKAAGGQCIVQKN